MKIKSLCFLILAFFGGNLWAGTCTFTDGQIPTPALSLSAQDAALPFLISKNWHEVSSMLASCKGFENVNFYSLANNVVSLSSQRIIVDGESFAIYNSGIRGVGIIMSAGDINDVYKPFTATEIKMWGSSTSVVAPVAGSKYRVRFVATEKLPAGFLNIPSVQVMRHGMFIGTGYFGWGAITTKSTTINVKYPACQLKLPATIKLPTIETRYLEEPGVTAGDTPFLISLECATTATDVNVRYTLTDSSSPTNTTSALGLTKASSTAAGLAIQVLEGGSPINFGSDSSAAGAINQRDFGKLTNTVGRLSKPFTVRYLRTSSPLIPGKVNAAMTITLSYQ